MNDVQRDGVLDDIRNRITRLEASIQEVLQILARGPERLEARVRDLEGTMQRVQTRMQVVWAALAGSVSLAATAVIYILARG